MRLLSLQAHDRLELLDSGEVSLSSSRVFHRDQIVDRGHEHGETAQVEAVCVAA